MAWHSFSRWPYLNLIILFHVLLLIEEYEKSWFLYSKTIVVRTKFMLYKRHFILQHDSLALTYHDDIKFHKMFSWFLKTFFYERDKTFSYWSKIPSCILYSKVIKKNGSFFYILWMSLLKKLDFFHYSWFVSSITVISLKKYI